MTVYDFIETSAAGEQIPLAGFRGKVLLIVNTATGCGFTPQYEGLEALYEKYQAQGLEILDFPCNQFGNQAPGSDAEITSFCRLNYGVKFPRFAKGDVNGANARPLFSWLKAQKGFEGFPAGHPLTEVLAGIAAQMDPDYAHNADIKWNFTKFLLDREGKVVARYEPMAELSALENDLKELL